MKDQPKKYNTRENGDKIFMKYLPSTTHFPSFIRPFLPHLRGHIQRHFCTIERFSVNIICRPEKLTRLQEISKSIFEANLNSLETRRYLDVVG